MSKTNHWSHLVRSEMQSSLGTCLVTHILIRIHLNSSFFLCLHRAEFTLIFFFFLLFCYADEFKQGEEIWGSVTWKSSTCEIAPRVMMMCKEFWPWVTQMPWLNFRISEFSCLLCSVLQLMSTIGLLLGVILSSQSVNHWPAAWQPAG